jgi:uncharacterized protein involved in cysteine biosynthesis
LPVDVGIPGLAEVRRFSPTGWLLGRGFFDLAALRHLSRADTVALRGRHALGSMPRAY